MAKITNNNPFNFRFVVFVVLTLIVNEITESFEFKAETRLAASILTAFVCCYFNFFIKRSRSIESLKGFFTRIVWQDLKNLLKQICSLKFLKGFAVRLILFCVLSEGFLHFQHHCQQSKDNIVKAGQRSDAVLFEQKEWIYHPQTLLNNTALIAQLKENINLENNSTCPAVKQELLLLMDDVSSSPSSDPSSETTAWTTAAKWAVGLAAGAIIGYKMWTHPSIQKALAETLLIEVEASAANII
jgi:hypothetical protein